MASSKLTPQGTPAASIIIVGGGVMGFCSAVRLLEAGYTDVTLIAAKLWGIPSKTSPACYRPDWLGDTPAERVIRWGLDTREHLRQLYRSVGSEAGITSIVHQEIYRCEGNPGADDPGPILPKVMDGFRAMTPFEIATHFPSADGGWHYSTFMIEGSSYMPWLQDRAESLGLRFMEGTVPGAPGTAAFCESAASLAERPGCAVVVNACGKDSGPECKYVRGQLVLVDAPYVKMAFGEYSPKNRDFPTYIYPRRTHVVLGSTYLVGDGDREVREHTTEDIIERCSEFIPELRSAKIISEVVCLRPGRKDGIRLDSHRAGNFTVVSCYGHGGAGMSLGWGCAGEVVENVERCLKGSPTRTTANASARL